jgi:hypothetical protein
MLVSNELERLWKEAVVTYLKVVSQHFYGGMEESSENSVSIVALSTDF